MEAWSTSQRAAASSARSREKREKYEGVWVMLEVGGGGNNASRHCGRNSNRRTVTSVYFIFLCILFFFLHYSSFMEVCTKARWATFIEINVLKVYFYIESSKV